MSSTRSKVICPIFGPCTEMKITQLPTCCDVLKTCTFKSSLLKGKKLKSPSWKLVRDDVVRQIESIWESASIPTVKTYAIAKRLDTLHSKYDQLLKPLKRTGRCDKPSLNQKIDGFVKECSNLFDIAKCRCVDFSICSCSVDHRVPRVERTFMVDQRNKREMFIGGVDITETTLIRQEADRREQTAVRREQRSAQYVSSETAGPSNPTGSQEISPTILVESPPTDNQGSDSDFDVPERLKEKKQKVDMDMSLLAEVCDRTQVSDRAAALIASATLKGAGLISESERELVIDRNRIRRGRSNERAKKLAAPATKGPLVTLYYDGRRDKTETTVIA